jgi:xanthine dehydrogenase molybdopterin-binding subunit B
MNNIIDTSPVTQRVHESAWAHVTGKALYTDDLPELQGTLHAALGLSPYAHARILQTDLSKVKASPGVIAVFTASDIPGDNQCGPIIKDDPILADGLLQYVGQPVFIVVADSHEHARKAARLAEYEVEMLPAQLHPRAAVAEGQLVIPPMHLRRGDAQSRLAAAPHRIQGQWQVGGQEQFYLEGQIASAIPGEGNTMLVYCSTQHRARCNISSRMHCILAAIRYKSCAVVWVADSAERNRSPHCGQPALRLRHPISDDRLSCVPTVTTICKSPVNVMISVTTTMPALMQTGVYWDCRYR